VYKKILSSVDEYPNESGTRKGVCRYELVQGEMDGAHEEDGDGAKFIDAVSLRSTAMRNILDTRSLLVALS